MKRSCSPEWPDVSVRPIQISLLHATYRAGASAVATRDAWLAAAELPERVTHVFSSDADDEVSAAHPAIREGRVNPPQDGVSAVRNWNAAADAASGDVLVVIADDLFPAVGWDAQIEELCVDLDPRRASFVIKLRDSADDTWALIRHPVVSRRYFEKYGLWFPAYEGHGVDNDFTQAAHRRQLVIDGRQFHFDHHCPHHNELPWTESQRKMLTSQELGARLFSERWPIWKRRFIRRYLSPAPGQQTIPVWWRVRAALTYPLPYLLRPVPTSLIVKAKAFKSRAPDE